MTSDRPPIRGVLFDLDDTLNDRARSWMEFARLLTRPDTGYLKPCAPAIVHEIILRADQAGYRPKAELFEELRTALPWRSNPSAIEIEKLWRLHFPACMVVREGARELLAALRQRGLRTGIVSNGRADMQRAKIEHMGLGPLVDAIVISGEVGVAKPDRRIFEMALDAIGTTAEETVFVGDHPESDIVGSAKMGMRTVWLANGRTWPTSYAKPTFQIAVFSEVDKLY